VYRHNRLMPANAAHLHRIVPSAPSTAAVAGLFMHESDRDAQRVSMPRPEVQVVVRFGPSTRGGLDVHVLGAGQPVHRKLIRRGLRAVMARLRLGAPEAVLGVRASAIAGRIVALEELWGDAATRRLCDRLADARATADAAAILERAIAERIPTAHASRGGAQLTLDAADRLTRAPVKAVALELGVSERHLRRVFHETVGMTPKAFAKLTRFHRALRAAREDHHASWATIAAATGYYDQAHLIAEFRSIAGATPCTLLGELRAAPLVG
jgi:AraC-like DNA-binding protein